MLLSVLVVCVSRIFSLSLLATVRGGTSFLCPKRQRNEAKKALSKHATLSVHSVQFLFIGAPKARCSPERRMCETLFLANPDIDTLRHQCSRASTGRQGTRTVPRAFEAPFPGSLIECSALKGAARPTPQSQPAVFAASIVVEPADESAGELHGHSRLVRPHASGGLVSR